MATPGTPTARPDARARARRVARLTLSRALQVGTAPLRTLVRAAVRVRPALEPRVAQWAWLWQAGWGRTCHERMYRHVDPYGVGASSYESTKFDLVLDAIGDERAGRALEVGCGEGILTARLATVADRVVAVDLAEAVIDRVQARFADEPRVSAERRTLPRDMPDGSFDLVVVVDVAYYWDVHTLELALDRLAGRLRPGGRLLLLHYRGSFGAIGHADTVHAQLAETARAHGLRSELSRAVPDIGPGGAGVRLDVLRRAVDVAPADLPAQRRADARAR